MTAHGRKHAVSNASQMTALAAKQPFSGDGENGRNGSIADEYNSFIMGKDGTSENKSLRLIFLYLFDIKAIPRPRA